MPLCCQKNVVCCCCALRCFDVMLSLPPSGCRSPAIAGCRVTLIRRRYHYCRYVFMTIRRYAVTRTLMLRYAIRRHLPADAIAATLPPADAGTRSLIDCFRRCCSPTCCLMLLPPIIYIAAAAMFSPLIRFFSLIRRRATLPLRDDFRCTIIDADARLPCHAYDTPRRRHMP